MKKQEQINNNITDNKDDARPLKDILGTPTDDQANKTTALLTKKSQTDRRPKVPTKKRKSRKTACPR